MSEETKELHVLGKISGYYGVKGWVKIYSYTQPRENIVRYKALKIKLSNRHGQWQDIRLDNGKAHGKGVVAHFEGYDNREIAASLIGAELATYRSDFKAASRNEFYWADLIGLSAINLEDIELGQVKRLIETAANDVLVISPDQKEDAKAEILIPFVLEHYVKKVDLEAKIITVDWPVSWNKSE
ncbi:MAG: ribosome maturation factor RimM [gamma proteobacterium symbiont of Lucinoma myriamae]|nr:ribosome maturation factor RimM [gamma proteobacterium symbiont of Lucinoma myriamae]MCU7818856.1 ribosome maturation factor RimM [gamma proteobacterium symbiont of Lucinoma myriamae]MCU7832369.1 ribosome maturation factor RimM [gamma proteobacterium symbiont of Lucinoma myriamae]